VGFSGTDAVLVQLDLLAEQNPQMLFVATNDTAEFVVAAIRYWLGQMGWPRYPGARELTITTDCGGSNGTRVRLWKVELGWLQKSGLPACGIGTTS
jgi:hypothetical protein